ncbi:MAG: M23 family metallopeptidase, partial [Flavobacteriaceae bacterium]|nr:M23 family metallopeptidase [Flavobacteriaceae bacterium]
MKHLLLLFIFIGTVGFAQSNLPTDYFSDPLEIPMILSGSFGELRSNHFHSGLDIKTQQREGIPVYAPADGYVSRIKVQHYGYGKALYLKHPNGYSTVYAHLSKYAGDIQEYVKDKQYANEKYELELYPDASILPVKKGEIIGYTGNSGSSGGPHLHYEIRDASSRPMNPMKFGVEIPDTKKPIINSVFAYP